MKTEIPVLLLTGYLGSGKTTLVNKILNNRRGIKFAVIVNDIGEVNIDADLIQKGGVVGQQDDSLVALQNGCICCTLKMDLVKQLCDIIDMQRFDYIVIEASGICEPEPIAQTICSIPSMGEAYIKNGIPRLDCIVTVVDALRMQSEFACGDSLMRDNIAEDDLESLVIQQIEFCNMVLLNKASEVDPTELQRLTEIVRALQPSASIMNCDYGDIDLDKILNTKMFDFEKVATSAAWIRELEGYHDDDHEHEHELTTKREQSSSELGLCRERRKKRSEQSEASYHEHEHEHEHEHHHHDDDEHDEEHEHGHEHHVHHHHHHHDHDEGELEEYGISTFVYYRRKPFLLSKFDEFVSKKLPKNVIRAKGICYFTSEYDTCYLFEQAGKQISLKDVGLWYATMSPSELMQMMEKEPGLRRDWDQEYGDRMQKLVFIGQRMDVDAITRALDECLL